MICCYLINFNNDSNFSQAWKDYCEECAEKICAENKKKYPNIDYMYDRYSEECKCENCECTLNEGNQIEIIELTGEDRRKIK